MSVIYKSLFNNLMQYNKINKKKLSIAAAYRNRVGYGLFSPGALSPVIILLFFLCSCELIVIGTKQKESIDISQNNPLGAVILFKTELDSNNVQAAAQVLASPSGKKYLAIEKYDLYDEVHRIMRVIGNKSITSVKSDTTSAGSLKINLEFNYLNRLTFTTYKINNNWYIISYDE